MVTRKQFEILRYLAINNIDAATQRKIAEGTGFSLGTVNAVCRELKENGMISDSGITGLGTDTLEQFRVDNAVIMAAGMGSRFAPMSYDKPKGLFTVKGEVIIERQIEQLKEAGINDITIVVGYKKEQFFYLEDKYGVKIVINPDYYKYNNTSTLLRVKNIIGSTYICSSDNYYAQNIFEKYAYEPFYTAAYSDGITQEFCIKCDSKGRITGAVCGGSRSWYMIGHAYFNRTFSSRFLDILNEEYVNQVTKEQLWEQVYIRHIKELSLYIKKYDNNIIYEFDSLDEIRYIDPFYIKNADSEVIDNICRTLNCEVADISEISPIKTGLTNKSFFFTVKDKRYVYRHPGEGTQKYISRKSEAFSMNIAKELGLDSTFIAMDSEKGWKISAYIDNARELDYHNESEVKKALMLMKRLHDYNIRSEYDFDIWKKTLELIDMLKNGKTDIAADFEELFANMQQVNKFAAQDGVQKRLCHCDCYEPNFMFDDNDNVYLIDWEYSGNDDPANDLGTFICCSDYTYDEALAIIETYLGHAPDNAELRHYIAYVAISSYYWYIWALCQDMNGNDVGEYLYIWYKYSKLYAQKALGMYSV